jgi:hypothetical protein
VLPLPPPLQPVRGDGAARGSIHGPFLFNPYAQKRASVVPSAMGPPEWVRQCCTQTAVVLQLADVIAASLSGLLVQHRYGPGRLSKRI